jgi:hypothetical protein
VEQKLEVGKLKLENQSSDFAIHNLECESLLSLSQGEACLARLSAPQHARAQQSGGKPPFGFAQDKPHSICSVEHSEPMVESAQER